MSCFVIFTADLSSVTNLTDFLKQIKVQIFGLYNEKVEYIKLPMGTVLLPFFTQHSWEMMQTLFQLLYMNQTD